MFSDETDEAVKLTARVALICAVVFTGFFCWGAIQKTKADRIVAEGTKRLADKFAPAH